MRKGRRRLALSRAAVVSLLVLATGCAWVSRIFAPAPSTPKETPPGTALYVKTAPLPAAMKALDFGEGGLWPGFTVVPGASGVRITGASFGKDDREDFPDPLVGDYAEGRRVRVTVTGLSRGSFRAAVIAQNVARGMVAGKDFQVRANGIVVVDERVSPEDFFSKQGFFYGEQFDDLPGADWWERYVDPVFQWRQFTFESNGRLTLELDSCRLYALVLAPKGQVDEAEFVNAINSMQAERKACFLFHKFTLELESTRGRLRPSEEDRNRGYVIFSRGWEKDVSYNTLPVPAELTTKLSAAGAPGERVPVTFSVRTLKRLTGAQVTVSDLVSEAGDRIAADAVDVAAVRYKLKASGDGYRIAPELLQDQNSLELPREITKRWWLTITVPETAAAGVYRGKIAFDTSNGADASIDLSLRVYPFRLVPPQASIGVWYEDPRVMGYCTGLLGGVTGSGTSNIEHTVPERPSAVDKVAEAFRLAMLEADLGSLSEHGFNALTVPVPRVVSVSEAGEVRLDFSALEPYAGLLARYSLNTEFAGQTYLLTVARQIARLGVGATPIEEFTELHQKAYESAVRQIAKWWEERGVRLLAYAVDEPREKNVNPWNRNLAGTIYYLKLLEEARVMPSTVTTMRDVQDGVSYRPIIEAVDIVQPHPSPHNAETVEYARESGKPLWFFNGGGFRRYDFGFYIWSRKPQGYWQWHFDFRGFSFNPFWEEDVGYVIYPSSKGPLPTLRYERAAQGIYDYRYALTLEDYVARAEKVSGKDAEETVRKAKRVLSDIKRRCPPWTLDKNWEAIRIDDVKLSQWRKAIAEQIIACQKVAGEQGN